MTNTTIAIFIAVSAILLLKVAVTLSSRRRRHALRARLGWGLNVGELARRLDVSIDELCDIDRSYRTVHIPKRRGGARQLNIPNDRLKKLQRRILRRLLGRLNTHFTATGFQPGISIVNNAAAHVGQCVVIKMDVVEFFPSTSVLRLENYFRRIGWNAQVAKLLVELVSHGGGLPQGAPTSPRLSNLVNFALDARIDRYVKKRRGLYTRYADDITISFPANYPKKISGTIQYVRRIARANGYRIHTRHKLRVLRAHQQQRVTGLVVNEKVQLTRERRRWLRAVEHRVRTGKPATLTPDQLAGWHALQRMIESQRRA